MFRRNEIMVEVAKPDWAQFLDKTTWCPINSPTAFAYLGHRHSRSPRHLFSNTQAFSCPVRRRKGCPLWPRRPVTRSWFGWGKR
jgi:hypothetical protein